MAEDRVFTPRPGAVPVLRMEEIGILPCIKVFESGAEHVYVVDGENKYIGKAVTKEAFRSAWQTKTLQLRDLMAVPLELSGNPEAVGKITDDVLATYPDCREIPLTENGAIVCVATDKAKEPEGLKPDWSYADQYLPVVVKDFRKIFVASLEDEDMRNFFHAALSVCGRKLMPLRQENLREALSAENLLVFSVDVYPRVNKCHVLHLYGRMLELAQKDLESRIHISRQVARIKEKDLRRPAELIKAYDEGHRTVTVEDKDGNFRGVVMEHHFAQYFPGTGYPMWNNLMLPYDEDEERLKHTVAACMVGTARQVLPLATEEGKVMAVAVLENVTYRDMTAKAMQRAQRVHWEYLSKETVASFFADKPRVLISSLTGDMRSFYESFASSLDITVYRDEYLEDYLSGDFDVLLYEADVWGRSRCMKLNIKELYLLLMKREVRQQLTGC